MTDRQQRLWKIESLLKEEFDEAGKAEYTHRMRLASDGVVEPIRCASHEATVQRLTLVLQTKYSLDKLRELEVNE